MPKSNLWLKSAKNGTQVAAKLTAKRGKLSFQFLISLPMVRWWIVGFCFAGMNIPLLYLLVEMLSLPLVSASLIAAEVSIIFRFLVNDRWVFGYAKPTVKRFWQYHLAVASSFVIWWSLTNLLSQWGIHYLLSSILATGCSVGWSVLTNFLWVWHSNKTSSVDRQN